MKGAYLGKEVKTLLDFRPEQGLDVSLQPLAENKKRGSSAWHAGECVDNKEHARGQVQDTRAQVKDFAFWQRAWQEERMVHLRSGKRGQDDAVKIWAKRSEDFIARVMKDTQRVEEVLDWLSNQGVRTQGMRILDIGSGPGTFTLPLAKEAAEVVAVEPVSNMVSHLKARLAEEKRGNVRIIKDTWEDVDIAAQSFSGRFDLVFASMSPGLSEWETVEKALACSRKYCYISSFAGLRYNDHFRTLWQQIYGQEMPPWPADIIFIANLLLLRGYEITLHVWNKERSEELTQKEAREEFKKFFLTYAEEVPGLDDKISAHVGENSSGGTFKHQLITRLGKVLVRL